VSSNNLFWLVVAAASYAVATACFFGARSPGRAWAGNLGRLGSIALGAGAFANAIDLVVRGVEAGNLPVANFAQSLPLLALLTALAGLVLIVRYGIGLIGIFAAPIVTVALVVALMLMNPRRIVLPESLRSGWLPVHVTLALGGYALFVLAAGVSIVYLIYEYRLKSKRPAALMGGHVPSLEKLDRVNYHLLLWGFVMLSLAIVSGAIWADATWGHYWSWEPQETWSLVTWILYASLLESRLTAGWRGRRAATLTLVVVMVTLLLGSLVGLSLMHPGKHGGNFD
jgi:cytochrome c-type biogenesis protein CcsB